MFLDYSTEQLALKNELRTYLTALMTPELRAELDHEEAGGPEYRKALRKLGADGWLGIGWPKQYGGQGRSAIEQYIFGDEVQRLLFPLPLLTLNTVGPAIMTYGTDAQRQNYLPRILRGECHFSIGYTEPAAGTDLASLTTTATRDGDHYVVDGQKIFTSLVDHADYVWLACRTDKNAPKHKGISLLIVDTKSAGFSMTPTHTLGENKCATTYYEGVRVPVENLVGGENNGWKMITTQLNHERVALVTAGLIERMLLETTAWAQKEGLLDEPWVQINLARVYAKVEALKLMNWRQAYRMTQGHIGPDEASAIKVFGSELNVDGYRALMEVLGQAAIVKGRAAALEGKLERLYRSLMVLTFGGGTNEVQRDIIANVGLQMGTRGR